MTRRRRINLSVLATLALLYVILFWGVGCADYFLLHPSTDPVKDVRAKRTTIPLADGKNLEIWVAQTKLRPTDENLAYVLDLIPNAGRAEYGADYGVGKWEGKPIEYWSVNYPGYGGSDGPATLKSIPSAALAAYDALARRAAGKPIFLYGYSLGSTAALHVAANRPVAGMILYNPPPLKEIILGKFGWWNLWLLALPVAHDVPRELSSIANGARCTCPAVFILGKHDTFVNYEYQVRVADAYAGPKQRLDLDVTHNDDPEEKYRFEIRAATDWLWDQTIGPQPTPTTATRPAAP